MTQKDLTGTIFGEEEHPPPHESRRGRLTPPRKSGGGNRLVVLLVAIALLGGVCVVGYVVLKPVLSGVFGSESAPDSDYPGPGSGEVSVVVEAGDTGEDIATTLRDDGVTKTRSAYLDAAAGDPQSAAKIQPGTYVLRSQMRGQDAFEVLTDPNNRVTDRVTIREGLWVSETYAALSKATGVPVKDYVKAAKNTKAIGLPAQAGGNVEGWLFPSTYEFSDKTTATTQLKTMVAQAVKVLDAADVPVKERQRVLTIASIVEGEARGDADRGKVARVVENRLADPKGPTAGFLQMDSTVNFALQKRGNLTKGEYDSAKSDPYDTYGSPGLPPGPIGNPGKAAINAAAAPTDGPWLYFVTVNLDTGETLFAQTLAEQEANQLKLTTWCDENPGKCSG